MVSKKFGWLVGTLVTLISTASLTGCTRNESVQQSKVNKELVNSIVGFENALGNLATAQQNGTFTSQTSSIALYPTMTDALHVGLSDAGTTSQSLLIGQVKQFHNNYIVAYTYERVNSNKKYINISRITKLGNDYTAEPNGIPGTGRRVDETLSLSSIQVKMTDWSAFAGFVNDPNVSAVRLIYSDHTVVSKLSSSDRLFLASSYGSTHLDLQEIDLLNAKMNTIKRITIGDSQS
ncbi:hypothetical protein JZ785_11330 [Alicyclobacillus curvatus]|nr:hypothetical protein JZ785_11330 [Alicyclobacillus curvatus]